MESSCWEYMGTVKWDTKLLEYAVAINIANTAHEVTMYLAALTSVCDDGTAAKAMMPTVSSRHLLQVLRPKEETLTSCYYVLH